LLRLDDPILNFEIPNIFGKAEVTILKLCTLIEDNGFKPKIQNWIKMGVV